MLKKVSHKLPQKLPLKHFSTITSTFTHTPSTQLKQKYDTIIIGAGHNGLICANYLAKAGQSVAVLEKRHRVGGCAVTEELHPGYKFSRCSYVLALFRQKIIDELFSEDFHSEVKLLPRNPKGLTPTKEPNQYLLRRMEMSSLEKEIAKFSTKDAVSMKELDAFLTRMVRVVEPMLDMAPPKKLSIFDSDFRKVISHAFKYRKDLLEFYHFLTASAEYYLDKYLESDIIKGTYATDAVIGAMKSPRDTGSAYVLLHHVMGSLDEQGNWFYVQGGNGALSEYIARKAVERGVEIALSSPVERLLVDYDNTNKGSLSGVKLSNGNEIHANNIVSACDLNTTYFKLMSETDRNNLLSQDMIKAYDTIDYTSPVMKINLAVKELPRFTCLEGITQEKYNGDYNKAALDHLTGTIHMNSDSIDAIHKAYIDALAGSNSLKPIIEMTIPSLLDKTISPEGHHTIGLFCQYAPKKDYGYWTEEEKMKFAERIYSDIEEYAPGFKDTIVYQDVLSPHDLEREFSITGGNIFHGGMDLSSIFFCRPFIGASSYKQPVRNLFACSAAMHPGGGVMGAPGRNCAFTMLGNSSLL